MLPSSGEITIGMIITDIVGGSVLRHQIDPNDPEYSFEDFTPASLSDLELFFLTDEYGIAIIPNGAASPPYSLSDFYGAAWYPEE